MLRVICLFALLFGHDCDGGTATIDRRAEARISKLANETKQESDRLKSLPRPAAAGIGRDLCSTSWMRRR